MTIFYLSIAIIIAMVAFSWINGIDYMHKNHPDYKGEDLFEEEEQADQDLWDLSKVTSLSKPFTEKLGLLLYFS